MLNAGTIKDVLELQRLLEITGVQEGDPAVSTFRLWYSHPVNVGPMPASGPAATSSMIWTAVTYMQSKILAHLQPTHSKANIERPDVPFTPHLETFKLLHSHWPSVIKFDRFPCQETALMEACCGGNPLIPNYIFINGANPNGASSPFVFPLPYVIHTGQSLDFITKFVSAGAYVLIHSVNEAIIEQRPHVVTLLLHRCRFENFESRMGDLKSALVMAQYAMSRELITLVEKRIEAENG